MTKQLSIILLTIVSLAVGLLNLSCGGTSPNNAVTSNAVNNNAAPSDTNQSAGTLVADVCSGNSSDKPEKIRKKIKENIENDDRLKYQYKKRFDFEPVMDADGNATLHIWGSIFIQEKDDLDNLHKKYKDLLKKGCVSKVVFTPPASITSTTLRHFEYTLSCEAPNEICSDGSCQERPCSVLVGNVNTNVNSKSNK